MAKTSCNQLLLIDSATYMLIKIYSPEVRSSETRRLPLSQPILQSPYVEAEVRERERSSEAQKGESSNSKLHL